MSDEPKVPLISPDPNKPFVVIQWEEDRQAVSYNSNAKNYDFCIAMLNMALTNLVEARSKKLAENQALEALKGIKTAPATADFLSNLRMPNRRM